MRIGLDARVLFGPHTGDRTYLLNLVRQFVSMGEPHQFVLFTDRKGDLPFPLPPNFRLLVLPRLSRWLYTGWLLPRACATLKIDLLHVQYIAPLVAPCPVITTVHDVHWKRFPKTFPVKDRWLMDIFLSLTFRRAALVITDSQASRDDVVQFFRIPTEKIRIIPLAAEERFFVPLREKERHVVLQRYGLTEGYVLFVGVLQPRKNLVRLLHAFSVVRREARETGHGTEPMERTKLVVVGKLGWRMKGLRQLVSALGLTEFVHFTGYVPDEDLPALYQSAAVFAYPALWEGFGLPVLEAMASGVPVLTSNTSSLREIAEGAAILVDPMRTEEIAAGLKQLLQDALLREELSRRGRERTFRFSWRRTAEETLHAYAEAVAFGKI